ncbi:MAG: 3-hexulose-6-phosphate synthase [Planctomycetota bacterium]
MSSPAGREAFPVIQIALDFLELDRAVRLAHEAVAGGADWLEAGTPLLKSEGLNAVRRLRKEFPDRTIVADLKTMDAGRIEVEMAAKAGADIAVVLGAASESTIRQCIEAGKSYGCRIYVDTIGLDDPAARAREAEAWGADYVGVHLPVDEQMRGGSGLETLRAVAGAVTLPVAAAGGINSETAPAMVDAGAAIIIVGGAVHKAPDATAATQAIRTALDTKQAVASELFKRGGADAIRQTLQKVSSSNLSDALHRGGVLPGIRCWTPGRKLVGRALTVRTAPGDWAKPVQAIDRAEPGDVLVIDAGGVPPAIWGACATQSAEGRGLAGVVIHGCLRDIDEVREGALPVFATDVVPHAGEPKGHGEIGQPVVLGGRRVETGDWILGDGCGVVHLPHPQAVEYANRAQDVLETENRIHAEIGQGSTLGQVAQLLRWERQG